jgi:hypothetical protein
MSYEAWRRSGNDWLGPENIPGNISGEATCILLAKRVGGLVATDDSGAKALSKHEGVLFVTTPLILYALIRDGDLSCDEGWEIYRTMRLRRRGLPDLEKDELCAGKFLD